MARRLLWKQVDVFADRPLSGSAVAVFLDGRSLDPAEMAAVAREINLPETTFVLPPTATIELGHKIVRQDCQAAAWAPVASNHVWRACSGLR